MHIIPEERVPSSVALTIPNVPNSTAGTNETFPAEVRISSENPTLEPDQLQIQQPICPHEKSKDMTPNDCTIE